MRKDKYLNEHILNIVQNHEITEQNDLRKYLRDRGYDVPQATLSRRLRRLKIAKVSGVYKIIDYSQPHLPAILSMKVSDLGLIVLHTHPGDANSLANFFDQQYVSYLPKEKEGSLVLGTIAGDDTVLLIIKNKPSVKTVVSLIQQSFPYLVPS